MTPRNMQMSTHNTFGTRTAVSGGDINVVPEVVGSGKGLESGARGIL